MLDTLPGLHVCPSRSSFMSVFPSQRSHINPPLTLVVLQSSLVLVPVLPGTFDITFEPKLDVRTSSYPPKIPPLVTRLRARHK